MIYFLFNFLKDNYSCVLPRNRCFWNLGTYLKKEFIHTASACYAYKKPTDKKASIMNTQLLRIFRHSSQCVEDTFLKFCLLLCFFLCSNSTWKHSKMLKFTITRKSHSGFMHNAFNVDLKYAFASSFIRRKLL